jgi:glycerophosphoryl diester phosphodiesterase
MRYRFLFVAILLFACEKKEDFSDVKIIAHAASGLENPNATFHDNSKEAVQMALETVGCDGVELDVQLSASNRLWFFHDPKLDKETNSNGCISSLNDSDLEAVKYKSSKKEKLLSLQNLPVNYFDKQVLMLDVRHYDLCSEQIVDELQFIKEIVDFTDFYSGQIEVIILLSNPAWVEKFKELPFKVYYSGGDFADADQKLKAYNFDGIVIKNEYISKDEVSVLQAAGKKVIIFEVRSPKGIKSALKKHPNYLVTDDLRATIIEKY